MKFENGNGHVKDWSDVNHNAEQRKVVTGRMSYITVTENAIKWWVTVNGLNHHEVKMDTVSLFFIADPQTRLLSEKVSDQPETHDDKEKVVEFSIPSWQVIGTFAVTVRVNKDLSNVIFQILNGLERMGYRVVTSSSMITGYGKHDTKDFIWTMHKNREEWDSSSK